MYSLNNHTLLYFKTAESLTYALKVQYTTFSIYSTLSLQRFIQVLLKEHHKHLSTQIALSSDLLHIGQYIPIFVSPQLIICPLYAKRSTEQIYINMVQVIGMHSFRGQTHIIFSNYHQITVNAPITFCTKKWKECMLLSQLLMRSI